MITILNDMARTSVKNGQALDTFTIEALTEAGWKARRNSMPMAKMQDGCRVIPDVIAEKGSQRLVIENKSNGPQKGTTHEKWPYALMKIAEVGNQTKYHPVMVIDDQSGKLDSFIGGIIRPLALRLGVTVVTKEQFNAITQSQGIYK